VILTQIRCTASFLNHDLHKVHTLSSPACSCGAPQEDANHFFFVCTKYSLIRNELFLSISDLLLLYIQSLLHYIENAQENKKNTILSYNIAENSKRVKRNEEKVCVCVCMDAG
jgi:hypothetical protein